MKFASRHQSQRILLLFLKVLCSAACFAQDAPATNWWPDPSTGLMWTGRDHVTAKIGTRWSEANTYCSSLKIDEYSGWRLPTLDEAKAAMYLGQTSITFYEQRPPYNSEGSIPYMSYLFKGNLIAGVVWTSTQEGKKVWYVNPGIFTNHLPPTLIGVPTPKGIFGTISPTRRMNLSALCVREMESDLVTLAKQVNINHPVSDLDMLKAEVPFTQALDAYTQGNYQQSITDLQNVLAIKPDFLQADLAIGICYAAMNQWDQAIASFTAALAIDKKNNNASNDLVWAKQEQTAQTTHTNVKAKAPFWSDVNY